MHQRIPLKDLTVGMYLVGLDKSWLETPFLRHRMLLTKDAQIEKLKTCGVQYVEIDTEKGLGVGRADEGTPSAERTAPNGPADRRPPIAISAEPAPVAKVPFEEELEVARKVYFEAKNVVESAMREVRMGREINTEAAAKVVDGMVDSVLRNVDALASLSRLKSFDEYTFFHSVNTAVLGLGLGRSLEMDRKTLHGLGMGALLHDIGKTKIPLDLLNKPARYTPDEFEMVKQHALRGAEILTATDGLLEEAVWPALQHHERMDGTGYPYGRKKNELTLFGRISSVVDIYDAVTSDRVYHKAMTPHAALQMLYSLGQQGHLDPPLVERFIHCIGIYPVGSCVLLDTGETGIVSQIYQERPLTPKLLLVRDANANPIVHPLSIDLLDGAEAKKRTIAQVLDPGALGINTAEYLGAGA